MSKGPGCGILSAFISMSRCQFGLLNFVLRTFRKNVHDSAFKPLLHLEGEKLPRTLGPMTINPRNGQTNVSLGLNQLGNSHSF